MTPDPSKDFLRSGVDSGALGDIRTDEDVELNAEPKTYDEIRRRRRGYRYGRRLKVLVPVRPSQT